MDQVFVGHWTLPLDDLYFKLKPEIINLGEVDYPALIEGKPHQVRSNPEGANQLFRIGDAMSSRNIHPAVNDALRQSITL